MYPTSKGKIFNRASIILPFLFRHKRIGSYIMQHFNRLVFNYLSWYFYVLKSLYAPKYRCVSKGSPFEKLLSRLCRHTMHFVCISKRIAFSVAIMRFVLKKKPELRPPNLPDDNEPAAKPGISLIVGFVSIRAGLKFWQLIV